jgi:hypothetical protein
MKKTFNSESFREQAVQPASAVDGLRRGERSTPKDFASKRPTPNARPHLRGAKR